MGVYSTVDISRARAIEIIKKFIDSASNRELADVLFALLKEKTLSNYCVKDSCEDYFALYWLLSEE